MKRFAPLILFSLFFNSCLTKPDSKSTDSDKLEIDDSLELNNSRDLIYLNFRINNSGKDGYAFIQFDSSTIILPSEMIDMINESYKYCGSCYGLDDISDTTILLDFSKEYSVSGFELIDINFDGNVDIRFPSEASCCMGNNVIFNTWLNSGDSFRYQKDLSQMPIWKVDEKKKTIMTGWHMSAYDYGQFTYKFDNDSLVLIQEINSELLYDTIIQKIEKNLIDNKWVSDTTIDKL